MDPNGLDIQLDPSSSLEQTRVRSNVPNICSADEMTGLIATFPWNGVDREREMVNEEG